MRTFRTVILIAVVFAVFIVLAVKNNREKTEVATSKTTPTATSGISPAEQVLADAKEAGRPVWLLLHTSTCPPCIEREKIYKEVQPEFEGKVVFLKVNIDDPAETSLIERYRIDFVPKSVFYDKSGEIIETQIGAFPADELRAELKKMLEKK